MTESAPQLGGDRAEKLSGNEPMRSGDYYVSLALEGKQIPGTIGYELELMTEAIKDLNDAVDETLPAGIRWLLMQLGRIIDHD